MTRRGPSLFNMVKFFVRLNRNRSFKKQVQSNCTIETNSGLMVQSWGEKLIANYLDKNEIKYYYDYRTTLTRKGKWIRPDFYLPNHEIYIEFWGLMKDQNYRKKARVKKMRYTKADKSLISVYHKDLKNITSFLDNEFKKFI